MIAEADAAVGAVQMSDEQFETYKAWCIGRIQYFAARGRKAGTNEADAFLKRMRVEGSVAYTSGTWWVR